jgi:hypothetical protein
MVVVDRHAAAATFTGKSGTNTANHLLSAGLRPVGHELSDVTGRLGCKGREKLTCRVMVGAGTSRTFRYVRRLRVRVRAFVVRGDVSR